MTASSAPSIADAADGMPAPAFAVRREVRRRERGRHVRSAALVVPLVLLNLVAFLIPVGLLLARSVQDPAVPSGLPRTVAALSAAQPAASPVPPEQVFASLAEDLARARSNADGTVGIVASRLNEDYPGARGLLQSTARRLPAQSAGTWRQTFEDLDARWADPLLWAAFRDASSRITGHYYLSALDLTRDVGGSIAAKPRDQRIYVTLFLRTLLVGVAVSGFCVLLGFPLSYGLAHMRERRANLLLILVLLPFWTSILVRIVSWIVLLQTNGVINDILVALGIVGDQDRLSLIYNMTGTIIAMTHILLPFLILPLYSVMRTIPPSLVRAATSLGASDWTAFRRVYLPLTFPGVLAGSSTVFILAVGYFITPALVGGESGQLIGNMIAYHMQQSLNWGLAAALSTLLLAGVAALYLVYAALLRDRR